MKHYFNIGFLIILLLILAALKVEFWVFLIPILIFLVVLFIGVYNIRFNYFLKSYHQNSTLKEKKIALTFDDGPTEFTPHFLTLLKTFDQKATFFCIGKQIEKHPEIFRQIIEEGHEIGNHTFSHSNKTGFLSTQKMTNEILRNGETIFHQGKIRTDLYRPPFGITNPNIAKAIKKTGKKSIGWNIRSFDTAINSEEKILNRILPKVKPGSVILLHDTSEKSANVLEKLLVFLQQNAYESISVSELHNFKK